MAISFGVNSNANKQLNNHPNSAPAQEASSNGQAKLTQQSFGVPGAHKFTVSPTKTTTPGAKTTVDWANELDSIVAKANTHIDAVVKSGYDAANMQSTNDMLDSATANLDYWKQNEATLNANSKNGTAGTDLVKYAQNIVDQLTQVQGKQSVRATITEKTQQSYGNNYEKAIQIEESQQATRWADGSPKKAAAPIDNTKRYAAASVTGVTHIYNTLYNKKDENGDYVLTDNQRKILQASYLALGPNKQVAALNDLADIGVDLSAEDAEKYVTDLARVYRVEMPEYTGWSGEENFATNLIDSALSSTNLLSTLNDGDLAAEFSKRAKAWADALEVSRADSAVDNSRAIPGAPVSSNATREAEQEAAQNLGALVAEVDACIGLADISIEALNCAWAEARKSPEYKNQSLTIDAYYTAEIEKLTAWRAELYGATQGKSAEAVAEARKNESAWFKKAEGTALQNILGSGADALLNVLRGVLTTFEGASDLLLYGTAGVQSAFGADGALRTKSAAQQNTTDLIVGNVLGQNKVDKNSVFAGASDSVQQGFGQLLLLYAVGSATKSAGLSQKAAGMVVDLLMGTSSAGNGMSEAYEAGASDVEAVVFGVLSGAAEVLSEHLFGSLGGTGFEYEKGLIKLDDELAAKLTSRIKNALLQHAAEKVVDIAIDMGQEGLEEVMAGFLTAVAKKLTYMGVENILDLIKDEKLLEAFTIGAATAFFGNVVLGRGKGKETANATTIDNANDAPYNNSISVDRVVQELVDRGMKQETAEAKADIVVRLANGESVTDQEIKSLDPRNKKAQELFSRLTGVSFDANLSNPDLFARYRSAATVTAQTTGQTASPVAEVMNPREVNEVTIADGRVISRDLFVEAVVEDGYSVEDAHQAFDSMVQLERKGEKIGLTNPTQQEDTNYEQRVAQETERTGEEVQGRTRGPDNLSPELRGDSLQNSPEQRGSLYEGAGRTAAEGGPGRDLGRTKGPEPRAESRGRSYDSRDSRPQGRTTPQRGAEEQVNPAFPNQEEARKIERSRPQVARKTFATSKGNIEAAVMSESDLDKVPGADIIREKAERVGCTVHGTMGDIVAENGFRGDGATLHNLKVILLQANNRVRSFLTNGYHEIFHVYVHAQRVVYNRALNAVKELGLSETRLAEQSVNKYSKHYAKEFGEFNEQNKHLYFEEMLGDIYAGNNQRLQLPDDVFQELHDAVTGAVEQWEAQYDRNHPRTKNTVEGDTERSWSAEDMTANYEVGLRGEPKNMPKTKADWNAFNRSFSNQTRNIPAGKEKPIVIYTLDHIYFVTADGYMRGFIENKIHLRYKNKINAYRKEFRDAIQQRENPDSLAEGYWNDRGRGSSDNVRAGHLGEAGYVGRVSDPQQTSDGAGHLEGGLSYFEDDLTELDLGPGAMHYDGNGHAYQVGEDGVWREMDLSDTPDHVWSANSDELNYSSTQYAPTFYSQMEKVIEGMKQEKFGASSVVSMLRGRGVKVEEIKWSGIETFLEGKKSVTKQELLEFVRANTLNVEVRSLGKTIDLMDANTGEVYSSWDAAYEEAVRVAEGLGYSEEEVMTDFGLTDDNFGFYVHDANTGDDVELLYVVTNTGDNTRWGEYATEGGENYREFLYVLPGSTYSNGAMSAHWGGAGSREGVLAHARVQDMSTDDFGQMLFIEEIQSDWHNAGAAEGYRAKENSALYDELQSLIDKKANTGRLSPEETARRDELAEKLLPKFADFRRRKSELQSRPSQEPLSSFVKKLADYAFGGNTEFATNSLFSARDEKAYLERYRDGLALTPEEETAVRAFIEDRRAWSDEHTVYSFNGGVEDELLTLVPDAPYAKTYHEFVLKNLIREAAEGGYDSIGWTTADMQVERWSERFEEGYRIEYDQDIPKFMRKYGRQWGAEVTKTTIGDIDAGYWDAVWVMNIPDAMRKSALYEGQPRFSANSEAALEQRHEKIISDIVGKMKELGLPIKDKFLNSYGLKNTYIGEVYDLSDFLLSGDDSALYELDDADRDVLESYEQELAAVIDENEQNPSAKKTDDKMPVDSVAKILEYAKTAAFDEAYDIPDETYDESEMSELNSDFPDHLLTGSQDSNSGYPFDYAASDIDRKINRTLQTDRRGFTPTDTAEFDAWANEQKDGKQFQVYQNADGSPMVFLRGSATLGRTVNRDYRDSRATGTYHTLLSQVAKHYALGTTMPKSAKTGHWSGTKMSHVATKANEDPEFIEYKRKYFRNWSAVRRFIADWYYASSADHGLRLIGTKDGKRSSLTNADTFVLQSNVNDRGLRDSSWSDLGSFANTEQGLEEFNHQFGQVMHEQGLGVAGFEKVYLRYTKKLVYDAQGITYQDLPEWTLPKDLRHGTGRQTIHIEELARRAFEAGYDLVEVQNVMDAPGMTVQTQYITRDPLQSKSVYNKGSWSTTDPDRMFSASDDRDVMRRLFETYGKLTPEQMARRIETLERRAQEVEDARDAEKLKAELDAEDNALAWQIWHKSETRKASRTQLDRVEAVKKQAKADTKKALAEQKEISDAELAVARDDKVKALQDQNLAWQMYHIRKSRTQHFGDMMAMKRLAAKRLRLKETAYAQEKAENKQRSVLRRKAAKQALSDDRKVAERRAKIEQEQGMVNTLRQDPKHRAFKAKVQEAAQKLRVYGRDAYRVFVNAAEAIDRFSKRQVSDTRAGTLVTVLGGVNSTVENIFNNGLVAPNGDVIGASMRETFLCWDDRGKKVIEEMQAILQDYLLHRHNIDRMSFVSRAKAKLEHFESAHPWLRDMDRKEFANLVGLTETEAKNLGKEQAQSLAVEYAELLHTYANAKDKPIWETSAGSGKAISAEASAKRVAEIEASAPWVIEKAEAIDKWWDAFMTTYVVGVSISEADYLRLREIYPHYVPTYRVQKKGVGGTVFVGIDGVAVTQGIKKAKGSFAELMNVEDSFANLVSKYVRQYRANELFRNIIDTLMLDDTGSFSDLGVFDDASLEKNPAYYTADGIEVADFRSTMLELSDQAEALENTSLQKTKDGYKLSAWHDGRLYSAYISRDMYASIAAVMKTPQWAKVAMQVGNALTGPMKTAITGINPLFGVRNLTRDFPTAIVNSVSGLQFPKYYARALAEITKGSENWKRFQSLGGTHALYYNNEKGFSSNMSAKKNVVAKAGDALGSFNEITEAQTRFAEYLATIDRLGDTYEGRLQGIKNAAEVTVDFSRKGTVGKVINAFVPYWNPAVQGIDKTIRSVIDSPAGSTVWKQASKTIGRAGMVTVLAEAVLFAVLKAAGRYDEWEELDDRTKAQYYCVPLKEGFLKIPKSREWSTLLGVPFMHILEAANGREDPFENYIETSFSPNFLPPAILRPTVDESGIRIDSDIIGVSQALDLARNKDFAGRSIVPYDLQGGTVSGQYDTDTSEVTKALGKLFNFSPKQADYIIKDYFGDFGELFIAATAKGTYDGDQGFDDVLHTTLVKPWVADARYSNQNVSDYYDTMNELERLVQDKKNHLPDGEAEKSIEYQTLKAMEKMYGTAITDLNKTVRELPNGDEKDAAKAEIANLAKEAMEFYESCMGGGVQSPVLTANYANLSTSVGKELIRMDGYSEDYKFIPSVSVQKSYTDPKRSNYEYVLTDEQKDYFKELYWQTYDELAEKLISSSKYVGASDKRKAALLEDLRGDVLDDTKDAFFDWLEDNGVRSTKKQK